MTNQNWKPVELLEREAIRADAEPGKILLKIALSGQGRDQDWLNLLRKSWSRDAQELANLGATAAPTVFYVNVADEEIAAFIAELRRAIDTANAIFEREVLPARAEDAQRASGSRDEREKRLEAARRTLEQA